ncbi:MAG: helix-turn-helix domain-containing protein [Christensenellales bacterium]
MEKLKDIDEELRIMSKNFKKLRLGKGLTVMQLSKLTGVNHVVLREMEHSSGDFGVEHFMTVCNFYGLKPSELFHPLEPKKADEKENEL